jgi:hypothetical protein
MHEAAIQLDRDSSAHKPSRPHWVDDELVDHTRRVWGPRYRRDLSDDECIEIVLNMSMVLRSLSGRMAS